MRNNNIWVFNAGSSYEGNPKWLFEYVVHYHPEIEPWWFCYNTELVDFMQSLGHNACLYDSKDAQRVGEQAGVYVVNQFKEQTPGYLVGATVLNLWHGVGCKTVERGVTEGFLHERIVRKYIQHTKLYRTYYLFLATSPLMEQHFAEQCGVEEDMFVRGGYPCVLYPDKVATYDHNILAAKCLPENTGIAVYAPTYRDNDRLGFFSKAIPDFEKLIQVLEEQNLLLVLKMHPQMAHDAQYLAAKRTYADHPRLLFWDNAHDFYEIMGKVDVAIVDYSSIFYDLLARGVRRFIRYIFDYEGGQTVRDFAFDYLENTCGTIANSFDMLLEALANWRSATPEDEADIARIYDRFWSYTTPDTFEILIERARSFVPNEQRVFPTLYSFDIFDTLIGRDCLLPRGIFQRVQDRMRTSDLNFAPYVRDNWPRVRRWGEANAREYRNKRLVKQGDTRTEIYYEDIFDRIQTLYGITDEQKAALMEWELECEYEASIPYPRAIDRVKRLAAAGETVVLASDMYLPRSFIEKLLAKADPALLDLPLYLSSETGTQKTKKTLYFDIFHSMDYRFEQWHHTGDNWFADNDTPALLGMAWKHEQGIPQLTPYEEDMLEYISSYDAYKVENLFARFRAGRGLGTKPNAVPDAETFAYSYASLYFVPYVAWAVRHAVESGLDCLYFISRDGYILKAIADAIIEVRGYQIETRYIYGSRKAWRLPSQIDDLDEDFFAVHGHFQFPKDYNAFVKASQVDAATFDRLFPQLASYKEYESLSNEDSAAIRETLAGSAEYRELLLEQAANAREIVERYLRQEIDFSQKFAFVEYWGRGYTQACLARLLDEASGRQDDCIFYYARSVYPTEGRMVRHNFTGNSYSLLFVEAVFANMPYRSIEAYEEVDGRIEPVIRPCDNNQKLFEAQCAYLPQFARDYAAIEFDDEGAIARRLFDWGLHYFHNNKTDRVFLEHIAPLKDSVELYGKVREYAPAWSVSDMAKRLIKRQRLETRDADITIARSNVLFRLAHSTADRILEARRERKKDEWLEMLRQIDLDRERAWDAEHPQAPDVQPDNPPEERAETESPAP